ncbi:hypothetical protein ACFPIJ_43450 [Dactylosporangium cerinum]|uniref:Uncharacterized protein n=1 Tax=Dactylosporangium cerinum TaxID=1434730 RepID=A0ABV9W9N9_9ACTN
MNSQFRLRTAVFAAVLGLVVALPAAPAAADEGTGSSTATTTKQDAKRAQPGAGVAPKTVAPPKPTVSPKPAAPKVGVPKQRSALAAWQLTLNVPGAHDNGEGAQVSWLWITQSFHITATANQDVGPTPYYIRIYRDDVQIAICGTGTTCSVDVGSSVIASSWISADISTAAGSRIVASNPPFVLVDWHFTTVSLNVAQTTVNVGSAATLTARTFFDVGPSPFWTQIFDLTTGTRVAICGSGESCPVNITQASATTHRYQAFVGYNSATLPLSGPQSSSLVNWVTWSNSGFRISLTAPVYTETTETVTATASSSVTPTPWYIEIFDADTGTRIAFCGNGSVCSLTGYTPPVPNVRTHLVAFVSSFSTAFPPSGIQATSNLVETMHYVP